MSKHTKREEVMEFKRKTKSALEIAEIIINGLLEGYAEDKPELTERIVYLISELYRGIDRKNLESLVRICLEDKDPNISIGKGRELLGFKTMNEMRDWLNEYSKSEVRK